MLGSSFINTNFLSSSFNNCLLDYSNFTYSSLKDCIFTNSSLKYTNFDNFKFNKLIFEDSLLTQASFFNSHLNNLDFSTCDISGIILDKDMLEGLKVNTSQALEISKLLGIIIK